MGRVGQSRVHGVPKTELKVCGWMGYTVGDLRTSLGYGEVCIRVLVRCSMECNSVGQGISFYNEQISRFPLC